MRVSSSSPKRDGVDRVEPVGQLIHPTSVYLVGDAQKLLCLRPSSVRREVRAGRLRIAKRCGRYYLLGAWILEWIEKGELKKRLAPTED